MLTALELCRPMVSHISHNVEETLKIASTLSAELPPGTIIGLLGDLGAGKTQFARGLAQGITSTSRVHSPTFALVNHYAGGRMPIYHLDLYRLETFDQILSADIEEFFTQRDGLTIVEWYERWQQLAPTRWQPRAILVQLESLNETHRRITIHDSCP
ncbi:MAG: tRNA (adenosine(37)-N6)-threonylcarbamoyltransferase complex ATPase subunit type 1 TsaE [Verrucomicrobia bacterium]|nr:MAG: tRNA (adenosine(37)-N6)-threonylcarbamoyltransferase complex ATPase subunit type 1 TsaE [Verrucomicrobiota bacterium]